MFFKKNEAVRLKKTYLLQFLDGSLVRFFIKSDAVMRVVVNQFSYGARSDKLRERNGELALVVKHYACSRGVDGLVVLVCIVQLGCIVGILSCTEAPLVNDELSKETRVGEHKHAVVEYCAFVFFHSALTKELVDYLSRIAVYF